MTDTVGHTHTHTHTHTAANITKLDNIDVTVKERAEALEAYGHLSPTYTPNNTGFDTSLLGEHAVPGRTPPKTLVPASLLSSPSSATRESNALEVPLQKLS